MLYKHTNGIAFRRVEASDLPDLTALKDESWFGTHRVSFVTQASQEKWLASLEDDVHTPKNLVLIASIADTLDIPAPLPTCSIGVFKVLGIDWQSRRADVGWDVYRSYRCHGYGKKLVKAGVDFCFNVLNLHRLQAEILLTNHISRACAEEAGFSGEGCQPKAILRNGKWIDNLLYGVIAPEPT